MSISSGDLRRLVAEEINANQAKEPPASTESQGHHTGVCIDCYREAIGVVSGKGKYVCKDCNLPLGDAKMMKALVDCPRCHGAQAREVF